MPSPTRSSGWRSVRPCATTSVHMPDFVKVEELYKLVGLAETILAPNYRALYAKGPGM
jgi:hypothetical protein